MMNVQSLMAGIAVCYSSNNFLKQGLIKGIAGVITRTMSMITEDAVFGFTLRSMSYVLKEEKEVKDEIRISAILVYNGNEVSFLSIIKTLIILVETGIIQFGYGTYPPCLRLFLQV